MPCYEKFVTVPVGLSSHELDLKKLLGLYIDSLNDRMNRTPMTR